MLLEVASINPGVYGNLQPYRNPDKMPGVTPLVILLVTLSWVSYDGPASHLGGSGDTLSHFMLSIL